MSPLRFILNGYDRRTLGALGVLGVVYVVVFALWGHLLDWSRGMDWLLAAIWLFMTATLSWRIDPRRDLPLALVAALGGFTIEWWGTTTELWVYFTRDRPPLWIVPAWPVAALTVDRLTRVADRLLSRDLRLGWAWWPLALSFVVGMMHFARPVWHITSTSVVFGLMVGVTLSASDHRRDVLIFLVGATLGVILEYWGTSRYCWTYWTREVPPPITVIAHGFAGVAFNRALEVSRWAARAVRPAIEPQPGTPG